MTDEMGAFRIDVEIESHTRQGEKRLLSAILVDAHAPFTWIPAGVLEGLGVKREKVWHVSQPDGRGVERAVGFVLVHCCGRSTAEVVVFGDSGDAVILGARSLSGLNLKIDVAGNRLVDAGPIPAAAAA